MTSQSALALEPKLRPQLGTEAQVRRTALLDLLEQTGDAQLPDRLRGVLAVVYLPRDRYTTSSSMMPQKRNPDMLELIRGRCGNVYGDLFALMTILKGLPIGYNRDLQEDKRIVFRAYDTVSSCLTMAAAIVSSAHFKKENIEPTLERGFLDATSLAEYLVTKSIPFRTAHHITGTLVASQTDMPPTRVPVVLEGSPSESVLPTPSRTPRPSPSSCSPSISSNRSAVVRSGLHIGRAECVTPASRCGGECRTGRDRRCPCRAA